MGKFKAWVLIGVLAAAAGRTGLAQTELNLFTFTNVWRYYQAGSAPSGNWTAPDYDDSDWPLGAGALGFPANENLLGYATVRTLLDRYLPGSSTIQITSYYFRTTFDYPTNVSSGTSLVLSNLVDDGCVIYLNGGELARLAMPSGTPSYTTLATRADEIAEHGIEVLTVTPTNLMRGLNTLAVEVHQGSGTSSDAIWAMGLKAVICWEPRIMGCPPNLTVPVGLPISIQMTVSPGGCSPSYQWYKGVPGNATLVQGQTTDRLYYSSATPALAGSYFLVITNVVGSATSCVVTVEVVPDVYPPGIVSAVVRESGASNMIDITFTENLLRASATNPANYILTLEGTTNQVVVSNASHFLNLASLRVGGSNWLWGSNYVLTVRGVCDVRTNCLLCCSNRIQVAFFKELCPYEGASKYYNTCWARDLLQTNYVFGDQSWTMPDYDDSDPNLWPSGSGGPYYFDLSPETFPCVLPGAPGTDMGCYYEDVLTYYFRTRFVTPSNTGRATLQIHYLVDDGAVFYLNGVEIGRVNMPSGPVTPYTCAASEVFGPPNCGVSTNITVTNLCSGTNLLAAEVHQACPDYDADVYYAVRIRAAIHELAGGDPFRVPGLNLTRVTADGLPTNAVSSTHVQVTWDAGSAPDWHLYMATNVAGPWTLVATNSPFRTEVSPQSARFFTLRLAQ